MRPSTVAANWLRSNGILRPDRAPGKCAEHSTGNRRDDMVESRSDWRPFSGAVVGAQAALHAIHHWLRHLAKVGVTVSMVILQARVRNVLKPVNHDSGPVLSGVRQRRSRARRPRSGSAPVSELRPTTPCPRTHTAPRRPVWWRACRAPEGHGTPAWTGRKRLRRSAQGCHQHGPNRGHATSSGPRPHQARLAGAYCECAPTLKSTYMRRVDIRAFADALKRPSASDSHPIRPKSPLEMDS